MGLAILGVVIFHAPFVISHYKLRVIHDNLCCVVDLFLFFSGLLMKHFICSYQCLFKLFCNRINQCTKKAPRINPGSLILRLITNI